MRPIGPNAMGMKPLIDAIKADGDVTRGETTPLLGEIRDLLKAQVETLTRTEEREAEDDRDEARDERTRRGKPSRNGGDISLIKALSAIRSTISDSISKIKDKAGDSISFVAKMVKALVVGKFIFDVIDKMSGGKISYFLKETLPPLLKGLGGLSKAGMDLLSTFLDLSPAAQKATALFGGLLLLSGPIRKFSWLARKLVGGSFGLGKLAFNIGKLAITSTAATAAMNFFKKGSLAAGDAAITMAKKSAKGIYTKSKPGIQAAANAVKNTATGTLGVMDRFKNSLKNLAPAAMAESAKRTTQKVATDIVRNEIIHTEEKVLARSANKALTGIGTKAIPAIGMGANLILGALSTLKGDFATAALEFGSVPLPSASGMGVDVLAATSYMYNDLYGKEEGTLSEKFPYAYDAYRDPDLFSERVKHISWYLAKTLIDNVTKQGPQKSEAFLTGRDMQIMAMQNAPIDLNDPDPNMAKLAQINRSKFMDSFGPSPRNAEEAEFFRLKQNESEKRLYGLESNNYNVRNGGVNTNIAPVTNAPVHNDNRQVHNTTVINRDPSKTLDPAMP